PASPTPGVRPQGTPLWPVAPGRRVKVANDSALATQVGLGCGGLLLVSLLAILVATVLSKGGIPGLSGTGAPLGPAATATSNTPPTQQPTLAPTVTPESTATETPEPTATPEPSPTATPIPSPTPIPSATATPSS